MLDKSTHKKAGATFTLADLCFIDFEGHSTVPISAGTDRYVREACATILTWAIGDAPVREWSISPDAPYPSPLCWAEAPRELQAFYQRALNGEAWFVAHNATFDRNVWNYATDFPPMEPWMIIDTRAQATASGLPASLEMACKYVGTDTQKDKRGKELIQLFCLPNSTATPASHPDEWNAFLDYAIDDTIAMRGLFLRTRQLPLREWEEYWAAEAINQTGVSIDLPMIEAAAKLAAEDQRLSAYALTQLTDEAVTTVNQVQAMVEWLKKILPTDGRAILVKRMEEIDPDTKEVLKPEKTALTRGVVVRLIAYLQSLGPLDAPLSAALRLLQIRLYGGSKTPAKFGKMLTQHVDGIIRNQYVFNGASQTGRFCVDAETLIDTPAGPRRIIDLAVGDLVIGHSGQPRQVLAKVYKGVEPMYCLKGPRGVFIVATAGHRVMTESWWKRIDECFEEPVKGRFFLRRGCVPIQIADLHDRGYLLAARGVIPDSESSVGDDARGGRVQAAEIGGVLAQQDSAKQPDVRREDGGGTYSAAGSGSDVERYGLHFRTPQYPGESVGGAGPSERLGGASYRRRQDQQRAGQYGAGDQAGSPVSTQAEAWSLVPVGERGVWDISVAGDESYAAQGLIHHNSARGVQIHNLARDPLPYEIDAIDSLLANDKLREFASIGDDTPVARKLSLLIRPSLVAPPGYCFCWGDWSNIEARLVPWLADDREADERLEIFRAVDRGEEKYDIYTRTAAKLSHLELDQVTKDIRQRGKVTELAAGFGGGANALLAMAASYGMHLDEEEARTTIQAWREDNPWALRFWGKWDGVGQPGTYGLWGALNTALERPNVLIEVGRVAYMFLPNYLGGSLLCRLPSGRWLTYRKIKYEMVEIRDEDTDELLEVRRELLFSRDMGRIKLWPGLACLAAGTLVLTDHGWLPIEQVTDERVWDGEEWTEHDGVVFKGVRATMNLHGVRLTPDHKVLTTEGWRSADESCEDTWLHVRLPNAPGVQFVARHDGPLLQPKPRPLASLRRARDIGLRTLAHLREFFGRHGTDLSAWINDRAAQQFRGLLSGQLRMADAQAAVAQQLSQSPDRHPRRADDRNRGQRTLRRSLPDIAVTSAPRFGRAGTAHTTTTGVERHEEVFDLVNCGKRNRFVVLTENGPLIVHNCENIVQAAAADLLRGTLVRLEKYSGGMPVVLHSHDEVVVETLEDNAEEVSKTLLDIMQQGFDWSGGLPIAAETVTARFYSKAKGSMGL